MPRRPTLCDEEVVVASRVARRVLRRSVAEPDLDDLVQETLERLCRNAHRLDPEVIAPFAAVTARNLATSRARAAARRRRLEQRLPRPVEIPDPSETVTMADIREAVEGTLAALPSRERELLVSAALDNQEIPAASPAERSRLRRLRARARVEYLLRYRKVPLATAMCRPVLMALSLGDSRAQLRSGAKEHLLECPTCASMAEPLVSRRSDLALVAFPLIALRWLWAKAKPHPAASAGVTAGACAAVLTIGALSGWLSVNPHSADRRSTVAVTSPPVAGSPADQPWVTDLLADGSIPLPADSMLAHLSGDSVTGQVEVQEVVTHDGFWVGPDRTRRVWIEFVGPLRDLQLRAGDRIQIKATVVANPPGYSQLAGVTAPADVAQLTAEKAHLDLETSAISVLSQ